MTPEDVDKFLKNTPSDVVVTVVAGENTYRIIYDSETSDEEWLCGDLEDGRAFKAAWHKVDEIASRVTKPRGQMFSPEPLANWNRK